MSNVKETEVSFRQSVEFLLAAAKTDQTLYDSNDVAAQLKQFIASHHRRQLSEPESYELKEQQAFYSGLVGALRKLIDGLPEITSNDTLAWPMLAQRHALEDSLLPKALSSEGSQPNDTSAGDDLVYFYGEPETCTAEHREDITIQLRNLLPGLNKLEAELTIVDDYLANTKPKRGKPPGRGYDRLILDLEILFRCYTGRSAITPRVETPDAPALSLDDKFVGFVEIVFREANLNVGDLQDLIGQICRRHFSKCRKHPDYQGMTQEREIMAETYLMRSMAQQLCDIKQSEE